MRTIFIAGDSTAANKTIDKRPESGWGEYLGHFIEGFNVINIAENGRSTKSFIELGLLNRIDQMMKENDILLIQFGHNDGKIDDQTRYTTPLEYQENLLKYINVARKHQAIPILISSITRRMFENGKMNHEALGPYPKKMEEVARLNHVYFIDMFSHSQDALHQIGEENSKKLYLHLKPNEHINYPQGIEDNTHFTPYGAEFYAKIIAEKLKYLLTI